MNVIDDIIDAYKPYNMIYSIYETKILNENIYLKTELVTYKNYIINGMLGLTIIVYSSLLFILD